MGIPCPAVPEVNRWAASLGSGHDPCPLRGGLALRQRPPAHRPRRRLRRPLRRVQPVHADGGSRRAHGLGHGRARDADPGAGREGGRVAQAARRPLQPGHRRGPRRPRPLVRPLHPHHNPQPLRGGAGAVPGLLSERLHDRADHGGGDLPLDRPHPARPLHRGHLPHLRIRRRARRPVRQLRQPARPGGAHQPAEPGERRDARVRRDRALLPRPARPRGDARRLVQTRTDWRPNVLKFSLNLLDDVRPRAMTRDIDWGIPVPLPGWEDNPNKRLYVWFDAVIGYLSASVEWARRTGDPDAWRAWWNDPEALSYYFMGKDNITFHAQIWPAELLAYAGKGDKGGEPGVYGVLNLPTEVVSSEFLTMESRKFSSSRG